jgi:hypothetical protein
MAHLLDDEPSGVNPKKYNGAPAGVNPASKPRADALAASARYSATNSFISTLDRCYEARPPRFQLRRLSPKAIIAAPSSAKEVGSGAACATLRLACVDCVNVSWY